MYLLIPLFVLATLISGVVTGRNKQLHSKSIQVFISLLMSLILSLILSLRGLEHGWDTPIYLEIFDRITEFEHVFVVYNSEYFYWFINYFLSLLSKDHYFYTFSISFISLFFLFSSFWVFSRHFKDTQLFFLFCVAIFSTSTFYFFHTNGLRQCLACSIFLFGMSKRVTNLYQYLVLTLLALFTHHSVAVFFIAVELALRLKNTKLLLLVLLASAFSGVFFSTFLPSIFPWIPQLQGIANGVQSDIDSSMLYVKLFIHFIFCIIFLYIVRVHEQSNRKKVKWIKIFAHTHILIGCFSWLLIALPDSSERLLLYASYFEAFAIVLLFHYLIANSNKSSNNSSHFLTAALFYVLFCTYFVFIYTHPSVQFTIGELSLPV